MAIRFGCLSFREIGRDDVISTKEIDSLDLSVDFTLRVRNELHYLVRKKSDVLTQDIQRDLAHNLGYKVGKEVGLVENFMRDYFLHATNIFNITEMLFEKCMERKRTIKTIISSLMKKPLDNGFHSVDSTLTNEKNPKELFRNNRSLLLIMFDLCRQHNLEPEFQLQQQARRDKHLLDEDFLNKATIREFICSLLEDGHSERILRLMHKLNILGQILPEFGQTQCRIKHDFYHRFTADEHSLRIVKFLEELGEEEKDDPSELGKIFNELPSKFILKLCGLFHNWGKSLPGDDRENRQTLPKDLSRRLRLTEEEENTLQFILGNLYEMVETALHKDIHEPKVIEEFARTTRSIHNLNLLYLFTYAELRAVAPGTWTSWKKVLLSELYERTKDHFLNPGTLKEKPQATQDMVYQALKWEVSASEIQKHLSLMPEDYLQSASPEQIALHFRLIRSLQGKLFILNHAFNEEGGYHNLILCCSKPMQSFKKMVGSLTAKNLNILGTQIYLRRDGAVIIAIQVEGKPLSDPDDLEIWKDVKALLSAVLEGKKDLPSLLASRTRYVGDKKHSLSIVPKIQIDNSSHTNFTVIRVEAKDHLGMLYKIAMVFSDIGIQIHRAKISTQGGRGIDVFYTSLKNEKITFNRLIRRVKERLIHALLTENPEDAG